MVASSDEFAVLEDVLDRRVPIDSLNTLKLALQGKKFGERKLDEIAIGIDANVFLKLSNHTRLTDIIDYFGARHKASLIIPGQIIQEFWNNQFAALQSVSVSLKKNFESFNADMQRVDSRFGEFSEKFSSLAEEMASDFGYVRDAKTVANLASICEMLAAKAKVSYVPRARFQSIARHRKRTKTPPGFKDDLDGDFYVWADFLSGLSKAKGVGEAFEHCVLVTDDKKPDWSIGGSTHPILVAEVLSLVGSTFEIWGLDRFAREIVSFIDATGAAE